ncbi:hypothetical protein CBM2637_A170506 [Cupriavidus taiwanensis]|nr:hypothetical protein CBM2637_A170506 [Cupriavidus taiwanensis]
MHGQASVLVGAAPRGKGQRRIQVSGSRHYSCASLMEKAALSRRAPRFFPLQCNTLQRLILPAAGIYRQV